MPNLNLSPSVRTALIIIGTIVGALIPVLATAGVPVVVTAILGAVVTALVGLGIIPPQTGGTQVGVTSPALTEPPAADIVEAPVATPHGYDDAHRF